MKKEMTLGANMNMNTNMAVSMKKIAKMAVSLIAIVNNYYSSVIGQRLNNKQTMLILNAQFAFLFTVFPIQSSAYIRIICLAWLVTALLQCKNSGIRTSD